jgi:hypothetical protein
MICTMQRLEKVWGQNLKDVVREAIDLDEP